MNPFDIIATATLGGYFCITVLLGISLTFGFAGPTRKKPTPVMRMFGLTMLLDSLAIIVGTVGGSIFPESDSMMAIEGYLDHSVSILMILGGFTLLEKNKYPNAETISLVAGPLYAILIVCHLCKAPYTLVYSIFNSALILYTCYLGYRLYRHDKFLSHQYSDLEGHRTTWFILIAAWVMVVIPMSALLHVNPETMAWMRPLLYIVVGVVYFLLFRQAFLQKESLVENVSDSDADQLERPVDVNTLDPLAPAARSLFTPEQQERIKQQILDLMEEEHLYRNPDLCVDDLVRRLDTNTAYFYYFMRDVMHLRFFDLVNGYRIEEAKKLLPTGLTIEVVAQRCGYNSANTFTGVFKKHTGMTPSKWRALKAVNPDLI